MDIDNMRNASGGNLYSIHGGYPKVSAELVATETRKEADNHKGGCRWPPLA